MLTKELVDYLRPNHDRSSCSDAHPINGLEGNRRFRCVRCALLEELGDPGALASCRLVLRADIVVKAWQDGDPCEKCKQPASGNYCSHCGASL